MANQEIDEEILKELRKRIFITGYRGGMAHFASCFSSLEMIFALYAKGILNYDKKNPKWEDRDRFILSKGHAGLALYAVLEQQGLTGSEMLDSYLQSTSLIGGEPCLRDCQWIEATTGSLGHGLPFGMGMAMALKKENRSAKVYVMLGDGEMQEGSVWETFMMAPRFGLDNLIVILDCNKIQKMDYVDQIIGEANWRQKFESFGWNVDEVDGHDIDDFVKVTKKDVINGKPSVIIANTIKGKGVSIMENNPQWHFKIPGRRELKMFIDELNVTEEELIKHE